jgi:putative phosphoribosyl transferase
VISQPVTSEVLIRADTAELAGEFFLPVRARGVVVFAHPGGSSRHSRLNREAAAVLHEARLGTLLCDLLTEDEEKRNSARRELCFDVPVLAARLTVAVDWLRATYDLVHPLGLLGAGSGAAAALVAAADRADVVAAVVALDGRLDLAAPVLGSVVAPTLLVVGGADPQVLELNRRALEPLTAPIKQLLVVPRAGRLFEEPGALAAVAGAAAGWFAHHLAAPDGAD